MSQTGFPNGGIMPDDNADFTYSNLIKTEDEIKEISSRVAAEAYTNDVTPSKRVSTSTQMEGLITAGLTLAQYYIQQITYQGENGYGTESNPVSPSFSASTKKEFVSRLGSNPNPADLYSSYNDSQYGPRNVAGVQNIYFNLGSGKNAFSWDANGNLSISDKYKFTGINDFGAAPEQQDIQKFRNGESAPALIPYIVPAIVGVSIGILIFGPLALTKGVGLIDRVIFNLVKPNADPVEPFDYDLLRNKNGGQLTPFGNLEAMFIKTTFTPQELYDYNPTLFWNAFKQGLIPYSVLSTLEICSPIEVGSGPTFFLPNYSSVASNIGSNPNNWTYGGGGNYPRPFTSFSQRIVEATYSLGPFAKIGNVSGRIAVKGTVCGGGNYIGQLIFVKQAWAEADLGNSEYTNNGELFKRDWWNQSVKTKHIIRNGNLFGNPFVEVEVATASYTTGSPQKYDPDIPTPEDYTLLLGVVLGAAALGAIL
jgi:hypothetical protein